MNSIDGLDEMEIVKKESEIEAMNTYDDKLRDYKTLSPSHLSKALDHFKELLSEIRKEEVREGESIPSRFVQFRYDGGSKEPERVSRRDHAKTTAIVFAPKEGETGLKLQIKVLPYYEFESNSSGLRVSGYGVVRTNFLKR